MTPMPGEASERTTDLRVGIFGAGAIGAYVGLRLAAAGCAVVLVGRRRLVEMASELTIRNLGGDVVRPSAATSVTVVEDPAPLAEADVLLVTVKSQDTPTAVGALRRVVRPGSLVVSLQNGLRNVHQLRALPPEVVPGIVAFNVIWDGASLEQTTSGSILVGPSDHPSLPRFVRALRRAGVRAGVRKDIEAAQTGKLLINLNNGICAVAGVPIGESFASEPLRRAYAACLREGLAVARASRRPVAPIGLLSPSLIARLLSLPHAAVRLLSRRMIRIDARARSSTPQDLDRGGLNETPSGAIPPCRLRVRDRILRQPSRFRRSLRALPSACCMPGSGRSGTLC